MEKENKKYVASCSFGKDSISMLLLIINNLDRYPLDMVVFVNLGVEFAAIYHMRDLFLPLLKEKGIEFVEIDLSEKFHYYMFDHLVHGASDRYGFRYCGGPCRWGTGMKLDAIHKLYAEKFPFYHIVEYVGFAADEEDRSFTSTAQTGEKVFPLIEEGITEAEALKMCYANGFHFDGMYKHFDRLSCYCCRNKNLHELEMMYWYYPEYWNKLRKIQNVFPADPMKGPGKSVFDLEKRFSNAGLQMTFDML